MGVIRSIQHQWEKAEFSHQLQRFLQQEEIITDLFVGATSYNTVCNLIAAMCELPSKPEDDSYSLNLEQVFDCLYQCFTLLFVKEVEHQSLSQAEQLILSISKALANKIHAKEETESQVSKEAKTKAQLIINAMHQLEKQRQNQKKQTRNMGNMGNMC
ncbi:hypothetical protein ACNPKB_16290 [Shewanella marisflavi]|uniref:hypothetical protein n=1 Tax=Shewanella marisflavi TaxID=260364 RepID=UPI003AAEAA48